jgi:hypothetical protein
VSLRVHTDQPPTPIAAAPRAGLQPTELDPWGLAMTLFSCWFDTGRAGSVALNETDPAPIVIATPGRPPAKGGLSGGKQPRAAERT